MPKLCPELRGVLDSLKSILYKAGSFGLKAVDVWIRPLRHRRFMLKRRFNISFYILNVKDFLTVFPLGLKGKHTARGVKNELRVGGQRL
ncbi:MAG: hypothetical protein QXE22_00995 [Candidatus Bathyarchaeia archaeon]